MEHTLGIWTAKQRKNTEAQAPRHKTMANRKDTTRRVCVTIVVEKQQVREGTRVRRLVHACVCV
jgi:hypothetical protein